ncbi:MAG: hypothetical protein IJU32_09070, partial [Pyramidobacter sp.]|nr:hypothetical protein [Pyramidobacter sp.]
RQTARTRPLFSKRPTTGSKTKTKHASRNFSGRVFYKETLIKYVISCETLPEGLLQRTEVRLRSPFWAGFFGSDAFSQVSGALVKILHNGI